MENRTKNANKKHAQLGGKHENEMKGAETDGQIEKKDRQKDRLQVSQFEESEIWRSAKINRGG